jgi:hypothetical protein
MVRSSITSTASADLEADARYAKMPTMPHIGESAALITHRTGCSQRCAAILLSAVCAPPLLHKLTSVHSERDRCPLLLSAALD